MLRALLLALCLVPPLAFSAETCKVVSISDGDTFTCLTDRNDQLKVRMAGIDAPESAQPYGNKSKQKLSSLIGSEFVKLTVQDKDQYGRYVARVTRLDGVDVNAEMVRAGAAWVYRQYNKDRSMLVYESEAKSRKLGLWSLGPREQTPPWEWRKEKRSGSVFSKPSQKPATSFSQFDSGEDGGSFNCNTIKWCNQMTSCAEARYQLTQCGNPKIDGDGDGVPCEALCR